MNIEQINEHSALDNDLYKFTMMQAVLHNYPSAHVKYKFKCRNDIIGVDKKQLYENICNSINKFCKMTKFIESDLCYLRGLSFIKNDYVDFLEDFTFKEKYLNITFDNDEIGITIEGPWLQTILFEVPILAIVSEEYTCLKLKVKHENEVQKIIENRVKNIYENLDEIIFPFADFGTRRRFTKIYQYNIIKFFMEHKKQYLVGTSNVQFAKIFGIKPIGTMAHEWFQAHQSLYRVSDSQKMALETWVQEYRGDLGIALSDIVGFDAFLNDFDLYFSKLFDGCRHDSGDPFLWGGKLINHYKKNGINPKTKYAVFSDGLTLKKAYDLYVWFNHKINCSFGIGTSLTNIKEINPLQIVIKMVECNGKPVAKLSDSKGKGMCEDKEYLKYLKKVFNIKE